MTFNDINCYYTLKLNVNTNLLVGEQLFNGPYTKDYILNNIDNNFVQSENSIVYQRVPVNLGYIIGIPNKNGNNIGKKLIYKYIVEGDLTSLLTISPYVKEAGNDIGEGQGDQDVTNCLSASKKNAIALAGYKSNVRPLSFNEKQALINNETLRFKLCLTDLTKSFETHINEVSQLPVNKLFNLCSRKNCKT